MSKEKDSIELQSLQGKRLSDDELDKVSAGEAKFLYRDVYFYCPFVNDAEKFRSNFDYEGVEAICSIFDGYMGERSRKSCKDCGHLQYWYNPEG